MQLPELPHAAGQFAPQLLATQLVPFQQPPTDPSVQASSDKHWYRKLEEQEQLSDWQWPLG